MLSLAALNYRDVLASEGGPVQSIATTLVDVMGRKVSQATAFLRNGLVASRPDLSVYGSAHGTGISESPQVARYMAVSEALERWAFHSVCRSNQAAKYGFDQDYSTNGLAAFPGFFKGQARSRAYFEALQRWAVVSWWSGHIDAVTERSKLGITALRLKHSANFGEVALLYRKSGSGHVGYGYSAGSTFKSAAARAAIELCRNEFVIAAYKICGGSREVFNPLEKRCLHYAGEQGHEEFLNRVRRKPDKTGAAWSVRCDREIVGPWSRYATVWRVMPEMPSWDYLDPNKLFFSW